MAGLSEADLKTFLENFEADPKNVLARNVGWKTNPLDILRRQDVDQQLSHHFTHKLECEGKPVTNQKSSGRCWIFACLNCMRLPFMKSKNLEDFEFSQTYLFFWDKLERFNYELRTFVEVARRGEPADGRLFQQLLINPSEDGGQWHMLVNVIEKYGVVPKRCMPDSYSAESSTRLNRICNNKMRENAMTLWSMVQKEATDAALDKEIQRMNEEMFRIVTICLGSPPATFTWEYTDKDKNYQVVGPVTPLQFYINHVKPVYDMEDKVVLVNDPRAENPYGHLYTVDCLGNMTGGRLVLYINQPVDVLKKLAAESIKNNEAVWFGCDVGQHCSWKKGTGVAGVEDLTQYDYPLVFGTSVRNMDKAARLLYRDSLMTHAMVLTAVSEQEGATTKWRIENSWGDTDGEKGYLLMTDDWFSEYVYEIVVDKHFVSEDIMAILKQEPRVLPAWDPMGALARGDDVTPSRADDVTQAAKL